MSSWREFPDSVLTEDAEGEGGPGRKDGIDEDAADVALYGEGVPEDHVPEHLGELGVGQGQGPQPQVGGGVRDGAQHVLDSVDALHTVIIATLDVCVPVNANSAKWPKNKHF